MKSQLIHADKSRNLIVFLNGWGMDACILRQAPPPAGWDALLLHDYRDLELPVDVASLTQRYAQTVLVAWSMGVWAAGETLRTMAGAFARSVAINGSGRPIDARYGIPPVAYRATENGFREETRDAFYRNMCGSETVLRHFLASPPARSVAGQAEELKAIRTRVRGPAGGPVFPFDEVFIGGRDLIMPPENQQRFWAGRTTCTPTSMPHYPFLDLTWEELLRDVAHRG